MLRKKREIALTCNFALSIASFTFKYVQMNRQVLSSLPNQQQQLQCYGFVSEVFGLMFRGQELSFTGCRQSSASCRQLSAGCRQPSEHLRFLTGKLKSQSASLGIITKYSFHINAIITLMSIRYEFNNLLSIIGIIHNRSPSVFPFIHKRNSNK